MFSLRVRNHVSGQYKTVGKITDSIFVKELVTEVGP
jgi:hypothetical protein